MTNLVSKKCVPCEGGTPPLTREEARAYLTEVSGWDIDEEHKKISRDFTCKNFAEAVQFVNLVADLAEREAHHPDIFLHNWNRVRFDFSTHAIGGLSENDFIMAAKINNL